MNIAVFCGARSGVGEGYLQAAWALGAAMAARDIGLVFGGASIGLMGAVADAVLQQGGRVYGVMPDVLHEMEIAHPNLTEFYKVTDMHQRKAKMTELADAFIAMPGGIGTLDEFFEAWTWRQLGYHHKPIGILNTNGYFDPLWQMVQQMIAHGFLKDYHTDVVTLEAEVDPLLDRLTSLCAQ